MLNPKQLLHDFRQAMWNGPDDVDQYARAVGQVPPDVLVQMVQFIGDRKNALDGRNHVLRCQLVRALIEAAPDRALFVPMIRSLKTADPRARQLFVELAPRANNVAGHGELLELFRNPEPVIRHAASQVFAKCGGKTAFEELTRMCGQAQFPGREEAIDALVGLGGHHAIPGLRNILLVGTTQEKLKSLRVLGDPNVISKNPQVALEAISQVLRDPAESVVVEAVKSFGRMCSEEEFILYVAPALDTTNLNIIRSAVIAMARFDTPRIMQIMQRLFRAGPRSVRLSILETLESIGTENVLPLIAEALDHKQINVRMKAAEVLQALAAAGKVDLARTILWLLRSRDVDVKRIAADVARKVGDPDGRLWPQLLRFMRDEDWWVRERIMDAIVDMAGTNLTKHVVGYLQEESDVVRRYGVDLLMKLADPASLGALVRCAQGDPDWWVRERAIEAIGKLKDARALPYLIDIMSRSPEVVWVGMQAIEDIGSTQAAPLLTRFLMTEDPDLTLEVLRILELLNDPSTGNAIVELLGHPDFRVRQRAHDILVRWNMAEAFREAQATIAQSLSTLEKLLVAMARAGGDDLILTPNKTPFMKRLGSVTPLARNVFTDEQLRALLLPQLTDGQRHALLELRDVDFSFEVKSEGLRFRANVFGSHGGLSAVFRIIKGELPDLDALGLPPIVRTFGDMKNGLVLIGGPTGSGKSTTLAAVINYINQHHSKHIITLEDPIEVIHKPKKSLVNQREIGTHTFSFHQALRSTLREDPDVILVGEMRDLATISFAVTAAETGHLVFGTVHTSSADTTVDRLINAFPGPQQPQVRSILANTLRAVCCQHLVPRKDGQGRVAAVEVMLNNDAIANLVRKGKTFQIPTIVATSREFGMQSMDNELLRLYRTGQISADDAYMKAINKKEFEALFAEQQAPGQRLANVVADRKTN